ncbi:MAG: hypothetical protein WC501_03645 [Candidatus Micrarchaeia archaeon]
MRPGVEKNNLSFDSSNIFPLLSKNHFTSSGSFTKKGLSTLLKHLKNNKSALFLAFGEEGAQLFHSYYLMHKKKQKDFSILARDIIVANSILFNELKCGPDSYTVRQSNHLFSLILDEKTKSRLKKKFLSLVILKEDDLFFKPIFDSFITLYLKSTSRFGVNYDSAAHDFVQLLVFSRAEISVLRELDSCYYSTNKISEKNKIRSLSNEYMKRMFMGSFSSILSISGFFYQRNFNSLSVHIDEHISSSKNFFENLSSSSRKNYFEYISKSDIIHSKLDDLRDQIFENPSLKKSKFKLS